MMKYKFREDELIEEFKAYIDSTYSQHYSKNGSQTMDSIVNAGHGTGFCMGNIRKYSDRYGEKGETPDEWRKDLIKVMHYCLFQLFIHDEKYEEEKDLPDGWVVETHGYSGERNSIDDATPEEWDNASEEWRRDGYTYKPPSDATYWQHEPRRGHLLDDPEYVPPGKIPSVSLNQTREREEEGWVTRDLTL